MTRQSEIHPDAVLKSLVAKGGRVQRITTLKILHELCTKRYDTGERDFTIANIGRLVESEGVMRGRALYNAPSADYRALIDAWAAYAGPALLKAPKALASAEFLMRIDDPAIRTVMQSVYAERDKLKAQINTLKANKNIVVDRRPYGYSSSKDEPVQIVSNTFSENLNPLEREALMKAISPEYLDERGLKLGSHGEILNERGRVIFEVGFARAIGKILKVRSST